MRRRRPRAALHLAGAFVALLCALGCGNGDSTDAPPPAETSASSSGQASVQLDDEAVRRAGIELATVSSQTLEPEVEAYGRVLDPTPVGDAVANVEAARSAAEAADRELRRVEALARDGENASVREVEAARSLTARARADLAMAESRLVGIVGPALARSPELSSLADRLVHREAALVRIDVPGSAARPVPEQGAHLAAYPARDVELASRLLGPTPSSAPLIPGWGFLFLLSDTAPPVGTPVRARLRSTGQRLDGVSVPAEAALWHDGRLFVFVAQGRGGFRRRGVTAHLLSDGSWLVTEGLKVGDRVVVSGAEELLSADLLSRGSGDSP